MRCLVVLLLGLTLAACDTPTRIQRPRPMLRASSTPSPDAAPIAQSPPPPPAAAVASSSALTQWRRGLIAYVLLFFFGVFGTHHLYLGRNRAALLCSISLGQSGLGLVADAFRIPRYVRELALAEAAAAGAGAPASTSLEEPLHATAEIALPSTDTDAPAAGSSLATPGYAPVSRAAGLSAAAGSGAADGPPLGVVSASIRLLWRLLPRMALGVWITFHLQRLLPDAIGSSVGNSRTLKSALLQVAAALLSLALVAARPLTEQPRLVGATAATAVLEAVFAPRARTPTDQAAAITGSISILVASVGAMLPSWRVRTPTEPTRAPSYRPPRRSTRAALLVTLAASAFWLAVLVGSLQRTDMDITLDGSSSSISAWTLARCSACALKPDRCAPPRDKRRRDAPPPCLRAQSHLHARQRARPPLTHTHDRSHTAPTPSRLVARSHRLLHMLRTLTEHKCIKQRLEAALRRQFDRLCVLPSSLNKCFDWDLSGTRWQRVGLSLAEAHNALGLSMRASTAEVKKAFHKVALANHPDKVTAPPGSAEAEEAAMAFMKAQKAFEKIMDARTNRKAPSPPSTRTPTPAPSAPRGSSTSSKSSKGGARSSRGSSSARRAPNRGGSGKAKPKARTGGAR